MSTAWKIPPYPTGGEPAEIVHAAVARALREWEQVELALARLYAACCGIAVRDAIKDYAGTRGAQNRIQIVERSAHAYFGQHPDPNVVSEFDGLMSDAYQACERRDDIAHGVVRATWREGDLDSGETWLRAIDRNEYMLMPITISDSLVENRTRTTYLFTSREIDEFANGFRNLRSRIESLIAVMRKRRGAARA